ncbi:MAG: ATP-binding protein [Crocinitomicaceae bacterium]|nr:MAG: ATP-binding protein [Crocinitomicaceae bacterium]
MSTLQELIAQGEHVQQDFKFRIDDQKKIARTLCAFANTKGGRLLIGVKDNRKVAGCNPEEEFHMIEGAAQLFCQPEVNFTSKVWQDDFRLVLEINIEPSELKPHKAKDDEGRWKSYVRIDDHTTAANKILENVWKEQKKPQAKPEKFDEEELSVLRLIREEGMITLSKLYRKANLPLRKIDRLIVLFICWDLVEMIFQNDGTFYKIK